MKNKKVLSLSAQQQVIDNIAGDIQNEITKEQTPFCCGFLEIGGFPEDLSEVGDEIEQEIEDYKDMEDDKNMSFLTKAKVKAAYFNLIKEELKSYFPVKSTYAFKKYPAIVNLLKKDQAFFIKIFRELSKELKGVYTFKFFNIRSGSTGNPLVTILIIPV